MEAGNLGVEEAVHSYSSLNIMELKNIGLTVAGKLGEMTFYLAYLGIK